MNKEQVVSVMVEYVNNQTRMSAAMQDPNQPGAMTLAQIEQYIIQSQKQTEHVCSGIYDALYSKNLIVKE